MKNSIWNIIMIVIIVMLSVSNLVLANKISEIESAKSMDVNVYTYPDSSEYYDYGGDYNDDYGEWFGDGSDWDRNEIERVFVDQSDWAREEYIW